MYKVAIYDKKMKLVNEYPNIHTINYFDNLLGEDYSITGEELLTYKFSSYYNYQLLSNNGNYFIDKSVIGTFEVTKM